MPVSPRAAALQRMTSAYYLTCFPALDEETLVGSYIPTDENDEFVLEAGRYFNLLT